MTKAGTQAPLSFGRIGRAYGVRTNLGSAIHPHFRCIDLYNWSDRPAGLSKGYHAGEIQASSRFSDGMDLIQDVMRDLDSMFLRNFELYNREYLSGGFREWFRNSLEDPGRLYYAVFWDIAKDPDAVSFEWHLFKGHKDICREMIHGAKYTLAGNPRSDNPETEDGWQSLISMHGAIAGENEIIEYKPAEGFEYIDLGIAGSESTRSSFYLFTTTLKWPLLVGPDEICDNVVQAQEHAARIVSKRNQESDNPKEAFVIDHAVLNNVAAWGVTHFRVFVKQVQLS